MNSRKARQQAHGAAFGAREALEAAFRREMAPQVTAQVVFKRRRVAGPEDVPAAEPPPVQDPAPQASPRVHRLQRPATDALSGSSGLPGETTPDREAMSTRATSPAATTGAKAPVKPRRARRHLHGEVTTVYRAPPLAAPAADEPAATGDEPQQGTERASTAGPALPLADLLVAPSAELRKLLAQIARLELLAEQARRREAAQAVAWIKAAMQDYGIDAVDIGL